MLSLSDRVVHSPASAEELGCAGAQVRRGRSADAELGWWRRKDVSDHEPSYSLSVNRRCWRATQRRGPLPLYHHDTLVRYFVTFCIYLDWKQLRSQFKTYFIIFPNFKWRNSDVDLFLSDSENVNKHFPFGFSSRPASWIWRFMVSIP